MFRYWSFLNADERKGREEGEGMRKYELLGSDLARARREAFGFKKKFHWLLWPGRPLNSPTRCAIPPRHCGGEFWAAGQRVFFGEF